MRISRILSIILACSLPAFSWAAQVAAETSANRTLPDWRKLSFTVENDFGFSDRYYTNGLKLSYTQSGENLPTSFLQFAALKYIAPADAQAYESISIGQGMYVPTDIENPNPPTWDRPYAGWLYAGFGSHLAARDTLDSFTVNLGVVGPISLAEDAQKFYHSIIGAHWPMGWHEQIKNEFGFVFSYRHTQRIVRTKIGKNFDFDILATGAADLGNVATRAEAGGLLRFGLNMPYNFASNAITYSDGADVQWRTGEEADWHLYGYAGGVARFVGYDITLNGNAFTSSRSVTPKWLVGDFRAGISARLMRTELELAYTLRSAEFNGQSHPVHMFWSATLKYAF